MIQLIIIMIVALLLMIVFYDKHHKEYFEGKMHEEEAILQEQKDTAELRVLKRENNELELKKDNAERILNELKTKYTQNLRDNIFDDYANSVQHIK